MNIHVLQHVPFEGPGVITEWADRNNHELSRTRFYENQRPPHPDEIDSLVIMGGPMGVYDVDSFEWLKEEKNFIADFIQKDRPIVGICLGAQLLADALGGTVYEAEKKEIGWYPVTKTKKGEGSELLQDWPSEQMVFHWHGDTFETPENSRNLLRSEACENQFFVHGKKMIGIQFHLEITADGINRLLEQTNDTQANGTYVQDEDSIRNNNSEVEHLHPLMDQILSKVMTQ